MKLLEELDSLLPGDVGAEVVVAPEAGVQPVHHLGRANAVLVGAEVLLDLAEGQPRPQSLYYVVPQPDGGTGGGEGVQEEVKEVRRR